MATLLPDTENNNNKSTNSKLDTEGLSCSSAISGGARDNTTYVHADPANFRALVQRLTGAAADDDDDDFVHKLPVASQVGPAAARKVEPKRQKLQERRRATTKLEIDIDPLLYSTNTTRYRLPHHYHCFANKGSWSKGDEVGQLPSPISTMDSFLLVSSASPTVAAAATPDGAVIQVKKEEEERAIAAKGFYLHPSPGSNNGEPPKLLPLFPLHSPKNSSVSSSE